MTPIEQWLEEGWKLRRLFKYPLNEHSIVFDVGAFEGGWTYDLLQRGAGICSHCGAKQEPFVYMFEPVKEFYDTCAVRFKDFSKVKLFNIGLSDKECLGNITLDGAASSFKRSSNLLPTENVVLRDFADFFHENKIGKIDLLSVNIEGDEYNLFERLVDTGLIEHVDNFQVQFHDVLPDAHHRRNELRERFLKTHKENWCYPFVWESWGRK